MKYFLFSKFETKHFLFLSYFIISTSRGVINSFSDPTKDICLIFNYYYLCSFSDFLSIVPILIIKKRTKSSKIYINEEIKAQKNTEDEELIYVDQSIENKKRILKKIYKIIIGTSICEFLALYSKAIYFIIIQKQNIYYKTVNLNSVLIIDIIGQYIFNRIILKYLFYRHHYLSFFINILFLIILVTMDIIDINKKDNNPKATFIFILIRILSSIFYSIEDAFSKIIITYNSMSPYHFLFFRGIIVNVLVIILSIVFIFIELPDEKGDNSIVFTRFWKVYDKTKNILIAIILFFLDFLYNVNIFFIIDKFTSSHLAMSMILGHFSNLFISLFKKDVEISDFFLRLIIYLILIIASAIHNEFIILNFCEFQKHTKIFLEKEAEKDLNQEEYNISFTDDFNNLGIDEMQSDKKDE